MKMPMFYTNLPLSSNLIISYPNYSCYNSNSGKGIEGPVRGLCKPIQVAIYSS